MCAILICFFFFQAEDGIRDHCATGVQTCALPICDAGRQDYFHSVVYHDPSAPRAKAAARKIASLLSPADVEKMPAAVRKLARGAMVVAVMGQTFHGTIAPAPPDRTPEKEPPRVRRDPDATIGLLRPLRKRVRFPIMVPTVLEKSSS